MQEKLGLYGLTPKELKDHLENLNETWSHLEVGVRKIFPEKTKHLGYVVFFPIPHDYLVLFQRSIFKTSELS